MLNSNEKIVIEIWNDRFIGAAGQLYAAEYGGDAKDHIARFCKTYDHDFQKNREMRIVATQGDNLVGIQSLFFWPYTREGQTYNVLQSGNSIVAPQCRGQGVFGKILKEQDEILKQRKDVDFLIGFPVDASRGSFLKNGWLPLEGLSWRVRILNPLGFIIPAKPESVMDHLALQAEDEEILDCDPTKFRIANGPQFMEWRRSFRQEHELIVPVKVAGGRVSFRLKIEVRRKAPVAIIGDVMSSTDDMVLITEAFSKLFRILKRSGAAAAAVCYNPLAAISANAVMDRVFPFKTKKSVNVIVKPVRPNMPEIKNSKNWVLYRADIDTW